MRDVYHIDRAARERILDEQTRKQIRRNWSESWPLLVGFVVLTTLALWWL